MPEDACELEDAPCPLSVTKARRGLVLNTDFGLAIEFDGNHKLFVSIPKDWGLEVCHFWKNDKTEKGCIREKILTVQAKGCGDLLSFMKKMSVC